MSTSPPPIDPGAASQGDGAFSSDNSQPRNSQIEQFKNQAQQLLKSSVLPGGTSGRFQTHDAVTKLEILSQTAKDTETQQKIRQIIIEVQNTPANELAKPGRVEEIVERVFQAAQGDALSDAQQRTSITGPQSLNYNPMHNPFAAKVPESTKSKSLDKQKKGDPKKQDAEDNPDEDPKKKKKRGWFWFFR